MAEKRVALIIASYQYEDADLRQLVAPAQDAEALARVLADPTIGDFEVQTLLNEPSYKVNRTIEAFFADRKRDDLLLLYFSGHGIKDEEGRLYFATTDTQRKLLRATAIPATLVNDVMRYSRSRRQVLLLDCCYGGAFARGMVAKAGEDIGTRERFEGRGRVVLTASDAMQYAFEGDELTGEGVRSVFTHALVHGLKTGEADLNEDGRISLDELHDYVYDRVTDETPQQRPGKWAFDVQGEIIIARSPGLVTGEAELPFEPQPPPDGPFDRVRKSVARLLDRLRLWKKRVSRRAALLTVLALVVVAAVVIVSVWPSGPAVGPSPVTPVPDDSVRVGIASFADCPKVSDALADEIAPEPGEVTFESLDEIQDSAAARTYVETELDLVIWGQCDQDSQLTMHLEISPEYGPDEVVGLESITAQTSALDLDHAARLGRAAINYLHGDHAEAASSLIILQQEASTPSEGAELAFLQANSLLFDERYEAAISAYDDVLAYDLLQAQAYNNRGAAGVNWALHLGRSGPTEPYEAVLEAAINDLTAATTTTDKSIAAVAYINLGAAQYWVAEDYDQALVHCEQAITLAPTQPLGYVCRAAARYWVLEEVYCNPPPDTTSARDDLATAQSQDPNLAEVFFWRGSLALLQADCDTVEQDKQKHQQEAENDFRVFLDLAKKRPVKLFTDQLMEDFLPASLNQD